MSNYEDSKKALDKEIKLTQKHTLKTAADLVTELARKGATAEECANALYEASEELSV